MSFLGKLLLSFILVLKGHLRNNEQLLNSEQKGGRAWKYEYINIYLLEEKATLNSLNDSRRHNVFLWVSRKLVLMTWFNFSCDYYNSLYLPVFFGVLRYSFAVAWTTVICSPARGSRGSESDSHRWVHVCDLHLHVWTRISLCEHPGKAEGQTHFWYNTGEVNRLVTGMKSMQCFYFKKRKGRNTWE